MNLETARDKNYFYLISDYAHKICYVNPFPQNLESFSCTVPKTASLDLTTTDAAMKFGKRGLIPWALKSAMVLQPQKRCVRMHFTNFGLKVSYGHREPYCAKLGPNDS
jgi:hypothetical protein